jgi:hypothetical protein
LSALNRKSTNYKRQSIGIVLAAAIITTFLIAGTILAPIQSYALRGSGFTDTSSLKHAIRDGVNVKLEHRDQHLNQENLCYRDNTCRQSDVGQNTLGNDNSVTGFADQSDNPPQTQTPTPTVVPTPTPTVVPTPTPTATPTPTPTPIPGACQPGTVFDVTLQAALSNALPAGTVLCLNVAGINTGINAIPPTGTPLLISVNVVQQTGGTCPAPIVAAAVTSGTLPAPLSGTTVCVV